ncbi:hypothetical protein Gotur_010102 [Gossypium turneri]
MNSSLSLKIAPNGGGGSRFLVFVICLVADLTHCRYISDVECICKYQLTAADGGNDGGGGGYEKLRSKYLCYCFLSQRSTRIITCLFYLPPTWLKKTRIMRRHHSNSISDFWI